MANDAFTQQALADDKQFQVRVRAALAKVAFEVTEEDPATPHHAERVAYAQKVLPFIDGEVMRSTAWLVQRPNLFAFATSYDFSRRGVVTASGDADIESQLMTDWNVLAGVVEV